MLVGDRVYVPECRLLQWGTPLISWDALGDFWIDQQKHLGTVESSIGVQVRLQSSSHTITYHLLTLRKLLNQLSFTHPILKKRDRNHVCQALRMHLQYRGLPMVTSRLTVTGYISKICLPTLSASFSGQLHELSICVLPLVHRGVNCSLEGWNSLTIVSIRWGRV